MDQVGRLDLLGIDECTEGLFDRAGPERLDRRQLLPESPQSLGSALRRHSLAKRGLVVFQDVVRDEEIAGFKNIAGDLEPLAERLDRKSTRLNSSHVKISYAVFC